MPKRTCSIEGCSGSVHGRGWCGKHYMRWRTHGDPLVTVQTPPGEQYATLVDWVANRDRSECWLWPYRTWGGGYGHLSDPETGRTVKAHRLAYRLANGAELVHNGCHSCDTPRCCNPDHIFDCTQAANLADARAKGRATRPPILRGDNPNTWQKLTPTDVRAIRADNRLHREIAAAYGISRPTVSNIKNRKIWKWVS